MTSYDEAAEAKTFVFRCVPLCFFAALRVKKFGETLRGPQAFRLSGAAYSASSIPLTCRVKLWFALRTDAYNAG